MTSEVSRSAERLVATRLPRAHAIADELADLIGEPEAFVAAMRRGLELLADPVYASAQERIAPGSGETLGVRWPLIHAMERDLGPAMAESAPAVLLWLAQRLAADPAREIRLFALPCLRRTLPADPERSWQLLRRLARGANDWISVDSIADVHAQGVLAEPFRWAELEQLVYSDRRMERRLVGSALARIPHQVPRRRRAALDPAPALAILEQLMGDADDQVQKSLAWALREWHRIHPVAVAAWLDGQARVAAATDDGHRARVIRDALPAATTDSEAIRARLRGVRRRPGAPSTSRASEAAGAFGLSAMTDRVVAHQGDRFTGRGA